MPSSTLTSKGQITLPRAIRERLGLKQGDQVEFTIEAGDRVVLQPADRAESRIVGLLAHRRPRRPVSVGEMHAGLRERAAREFSGRRR